MDMRSLNRTIAWRRHMGESHREIAARSRPAASLESCPACGAGGHAPFVEIYGFRYDECRQCGHLFLQNPPAPEQIAQLYAGATEQTRVYVGEELFQRRVEAHVDFARAHGIDLLHGYVNELPRELRGSVSVLSALNLLEHLPEPRSWLARFTAQLAPGAHVVVEVPRHPSLSSFSNLLYPDLACRHIYPPDHMHIFTEASLEHVLNAAGLEARAVWVFGQDYQEIMYSSAAHAGLAESAFFHQILDAGAAIQRAIDSENLCDVLFVVARKR
jgi:hypothetical protein